METTVKQFDQCHRLTQLRVKEALQIYWEMEGRFLLSNCHKYHLKRLDEFFGEMFLHRIGPLDIQNFRRWRKTINSNIHESSINREHTRITRIINAFKEWKRQGRVGSYDFTDVEVPFDNPGGLVKKQDERRYRRTLIVTPEMFNRFCDYAHPDVRKICTIAVLTLLRRKDIRLLQDGNLNRALDHLSGVQSKTRTTYDVPASLSVRIIFNQAKLADRKCVRDFTNFKRRFRKARADSGVYFQFRDLRRSGATQVLLDGIDIRTIQKYLGHADISMTETYLNPPAPVAKKAARILENRFVAKRFPKDFSFSEN